MLPLETWPASELPDRAQTVPKGLKTKKRRGGHLDIFQCPLYELEQYSCNPPSKGIQEPGVINCEVIKRFFRRCANGVNAETTALEGREGKRI